MAKQKGGIPAKFLGGKEDRLAPIIAEADARGLEALREALLGASHEVIGSGLDFTAFSPQRVRGLLFQIDQRLSKKNRSR
ncbi:hypothetical protein ACFLZP_00885 [Patescibacteria group bacterium]